MIYFKKEKIKKHIYRINSPFGVCMYLIQGTRYAVLIDTGFGVGDLKSYIESFVKTPYKVFLSHGHLDHAGGANQFSQVYLNKNDWDLAVKHCNLDKRKEEIKEQNTEYFNNLSDNDWISTRKSSYTPLNEEDIFDLGDITVIPILVSGHTMGSVVFLIPEEKTIILGDACGEGTLICKDMLEIYKKSLIHLLEFSDKFNFILRNHGTFISKKQIISDNLELTQNIINGIDAAIPAKIMGVNGYWGRPHHHPNKEGNIFYATKENATW